MTEVVSFVGMLAPNASSIKIGQDGMRMSIDVPETCMSEALPMLALRNAMLRFTVEVVARGND